MKDSDFFSDIKPLTKFSKIESIDEKVSMDEIKDSKKKVSTSGIKKAPRYTPPQTIKTQTAPSQNGPSQGIWVFAIIAILVLVVVVSLKYAVAVVKVTPKMKTIPINETLVLTENDSPLPFETVSVESGTNEEVSLTEKVEKKEKAKGRIQISNIYNTAGQKLVAQTRFETKDGKIYRLEAPVTVPGYTMVDGKKVPGTITATVIADGYGESYNVADATFSIPGFKGSPQFDLIYASTVGALSGGLDGTYYTSGSAGKTDEVAKELLVEKMKEMVKKQVPEEFVLIDGMYVLSMQNENTVFSKEQKTQSGMNGKLTHIVFPKTGLSSYLTSKYPEITIDGPVDTTHLRGEVLSTTEKNGTPVYTVLLTGDVKQNMMLNGDQLKEKLAGTKKSAFNTLMAESSETVSSAELSIRPFWVYTIPKTFNRIKIINTNDGK